MLYKNKEVYVADGIMTYIKAQTNVHYANELDLLRKILDRVTAKINQLEASDPTRNWPTR